MSTDQRDGLDLTLLDMAEGLSALVYQREEIAEEIMITGCLGIEDPENDEAHKLALAALDQCDAAIMAYLQALPKKTDSVAAWLLNEKELADAAKNQADRLYELAKARESRYEYVKDCALRALQTLGKKVLPGRLHELRRWGNGGRQPVNFRQPELLPRKFQRFILTVDGETLDFIASHAGLMTLPRTAKPIDPDKEAIHAALVAGEGVPGAELAERGEHLRIS